MFVLKADISVGQRTSTFNRLYYDRYFNKQIIELNELYENLDKTQEQFLANQCQGTTLTTSLASLSKDNDRSTAYTVFTCLDAAPLIVTALRWTHN